MLLPISDIAVGENQRCLSVLSVREKKPVLEGVNLSDCGYSMTWFTHVPSERDTNTGSACLWPCPQPL